MSLFTENKKKIPHSLLAALRHEGHLSHDERLTSFRNSKWSKCLLQIEAILEDKLIEATMMGYEADTGL